MPAKNRVVWMLQGQAVLLADHDGHQDGGAEHGEHVLEAQDEHLGDAQGPGVADGFLLIHVDSPFFTLRTHTACEGKKKQSPG